MGRTLLRMAKEYGLVLLRTCFNAANFLKAARAWLFCDSSMLIGYCSDESLYCR